MAGLLKELLLDYSLNRLPIDMRSDLTIAIQRAIESRVLKRREILFLNLYLSGYTAHDIAMLTLVLEEHEIEETLERVFTALETISGYTDQGLVYKLEASGKYRKGNIEKLKGFLVEHSKHYTLHDLER